jgi:PAS domain-containing protein
MSMSTSEQLRRKAEAFLQQLGSEGGTAKLPVGDLQELLHELSVHQVELEMQGEELRATAEELQRNNERYIEHFLSSPIASLRMDQEGRILELNVAARALLGIPPTRNPGSIQSIYHSGRVVPNPSALRRLVQQTLTKRDACKAEIHFSGSSGGDSVFEVSIQPLPGENSSKQASDYLVFLQDRTEEIRARDLQSERFHTLDMVLDSDITGYWEWNLPQERVYYSPSCCRMLGYGPNELEESPETYRRLIHPGDHAEAERLMQKHLS